MAEVTVSELAKTVGASVDRLLMQMKEAGLNHALPMRRSLMKRSKLCWPI